MGRPYKKFIHMWVVDKILLEIMDKYNSSKHKAILRDYYILSLMSKTGMRVGELVELKVSDLRKDIHGNRIDVFLPNKRSRKRSIPISSKLANGIKRNIIKNRHDSEHMFLSERGKKYSTRGVQKRFEIHFGRKYGGIHSLRHSFAVWRFSEGENLFKIWKQMGHSTIGGTASYIEPIIDWELARNSLGGTAEYKPDLRRYESLKACDAGVSF